MYQMNYSGTYTLNNELDVKNNAAYYGGFIRTGVTYKPTFKCPDKENDLFTYTDSNKGTKSLEYPIGLTTIDDRVYAGNNWKAKNTKYYLYNGIDNFTMSPYNFNLVGYAGVYINSGPNRGRVSTPYGLRPVINLVSGSLIFGNGTSTNPYITS